MTPNLHQFSKLELMQGRVGFIPDGWEFVHLKKAFKIRNNLRLPINGDKRVKNPGPYPYYGPTKVQGYIGNYQQDGDYALIGEDGDHFLKYRTSPMTQLVSGKCTVNNHAHIIEGTKKATREWFYYYFMHRDIFSFLARQGAGRFKLNKAALEKLPILLPPLPEQKEIAQILSTWDKAIETVDKLIENSKAQKKALMQQLLTGKRRLPGFNGEWKEVSISQFGKVVTGSTPPKSDESNYGGSISWATAEDFRSKYIKDTTIKLTESGAQKARVVPKGSVLVTCIASIGKNAITAEDLATNQQINSVIVDQNYSNEFFYYHVEFYKNKLIAWAGITAVPILNKSSFKKIKLLTPSLREQQKIASVLITADREIEALHQKCDCMNQEKKALMQQLHTAKRRVKVT